MCDEAKRYAAEIASKGALIHSSNLNGQGENLSMACVSGGGGQGSAQNASQATTENLIVLNYFSFNISLYTTLAMH